MTLALGEGGQEPPLYPVDPHLAVRVGAYLDVREVLALHLGDLVGLLLRFGPGGDPGGQVFAARRRVEDHHLGRVWPPRREPVTDLENFGESTMVST